MPAQLPTFNDITILDALKRDEYETPFGTLQRLFNWFYQTEDGDVLDALKTLPMMIDYFWLVTKHHDTSSFGEMVEGLLEGDDPNPYNQFIDRHKVEWSKFMNGNFEIEKVHTIPTK